MATAVVLLDGPLAGVHTVPLGDPPLELRVGENGTTARYRLVGWRDGKLQYRLERSIRFVEGT